MSLADNKGQASWLGSHNPPPSFAEASYYSLNAFKFIDGAKKEHWVKWRFDPRDGAHFLSDEELNTLPKDFLVQRITERARKGLIQWDMFVIMGEASDPLDNSPDAILAYRSAAYAVSYAKRLQENEAGK